MANLRQYREQAGLQVPGRPQGTVRDYVGPAIAQTGRAVSSLGGALLERQQKRDAFEHDVQFRNWQNQMNEALFERAEQMPEGGRGFARGFMDEVFTPSLAWLETVEDPDMQARLKASVADVRSKMGLAAGRAERDEVYRFQGVHLDQAINDSQNAIISNPDQYDDVLANLDASIAASSLPAPQKGLMRHAAEQAAIEGYLEGIKNDPLALYTELGGDMDDLPARVRETIMASVVMKQGAVGKTDFGTSVKTRAGEHGLTLEMLSSIATRMGDPGPENRTVEDWEVYLSNPVLAAGYVQERVKEVQATNPRNPAEFFARFYMGDDAAAEDLGKLPSGVQRLVRSLARSVEAPHATPGSVQLVGFTKDGQSTGELAASRYDDIDPHLINTVRSVMAQVGETEVRIRDAERPNNAGYGASHSQHIVANGTRGALDIDVRHMSHAQRTHLIEAFSAAGIQGIGVYNTTIHVDLGNRRYWGQGADGTYSYKHAPKWAQDVLGRHARGEISSSSYNNTSPRLRNIDAGTRTRYMNAAMTDLGSTVRSSLPEMRAEANDELYDHIAALEQGGTRLTDDTVTAYMEVLTPEARSTVESKITVATAVRQVYEMMDGATDGEIEQVLADLAPGKGSIRTVDQQKIYEGALARADEIRTERREDPVAVALSGSPELEELWMQVAIPGAGGATTVNPPAMQKFIKDALEYQRRFNLAPSEVRHLPRRHLVELADDIDEITRVTDPAINTAALRRQLVTRAQQDYGKYAYDVLLEAIELIAGSGDKGSPEEQLIREIKGGKAGIGAAAAPAAAAEPAAGAAPVSTKAGGSRWQQLVVDVAELTEKARTATEGMSAAEREEYVNAQNLSPEAKAAILKALE